MSVSGLAAAILVSNLPVAPTIVTEAMLQTAPPVEQQVPDPIATPATPETPPGAAPIDLSLPPAPDPDVESAGVVITGSRRSDADPLEPINADSFEATQAVDQAAVRPVAIAYKNTLPRPARDGLRNFFANLREPVVALNYLLQIKPGKAAETAGRFLINSTAGVAGLFDVARKKPFNLPRRPNGLANTMGYYGVRPGPFFYLPLIGPTTLRDSVGDLVDGLLLPTAVGKPFTGLTYTVPTTVIRALDRRVETDDELKRLNASPNPYVATREQYLQQRQQEIDNLHGRGRARPPGDAAQSTTVPDSGTLTEPAGTPNGREGGEPREVRLPYE